MTHYNVLKAHRDLLEAQGYQSIQIRASAILGGDYLENTWFRCPMEKQVIEVGSSPKGNALIWLEGSKNPTSIDKKQWVTVWRVASVEQHSPSPVQ